MTSEVQHANSDVSHHDVIVVGAGFAGLYTLHRLRGLGFNVRVVEAGSDVGGTWYWNRYPGARCDVESLEYSYSFSDQLQQEWVWPERFSAQPDILRYIQHVADRFDLRRHIEFDSRVESAEFDEGRDEWTVTTGKRRQLKARFCIMATGNLSLPRVPDFPGLEDFKGKWYHSGLWPHEKVDFTGQRVGLIGTGASGIQITPNVAKEAAHLYVFQRTANYSVPSVNRPTDEKEMQGYKARYAEIRRSQKNSAYGIAGFEVPTLSAIEVDAETRARTYEEKWGLGGNISFLAAYNDILLNKASNETACQFVREKIKSIVKDPETAELLCPKDHYIGTKRLPLEIDYFATFNRDNVTLVDVRNYPVKRITKDGILTKKQAYELDAIIFATGFDAMTGALLDINVKGLGGKTLQSKWAGGPLTYLGLMTAGFPNFFIMTGPGAPSVKTNMIPHIEQHADWITDCIDYLSRNKHVRMEADAKREQEWVKHVDDVANATLYPLAESWYVGANIPGKPRFFMPYIGGLDKYTKLCNAVAANGYDGFHIR